jgi:hypothetical protein
VTTVLKALNKHVLSLRKHYQQCVFVPIVRQITLEIRLTC